MPSSTPTTTRRSMCWSSGTAAGSPSPCATAVSASRPATSAASSSASTGSTGREPGTPAGPAPGWPSSATSPTTTAAGSRSSRVRARDRRSRSGCRSATATPSTAATERKPMAEPSTTVLVVEDEESFVEALTVGLKREGFYVKVARDGAEALAMFDEVRPDLVLLDVMLPKMLGVDVCRELRSKSRVPIIMVTAKGGEIDTVVGLEVGADDYVTKPYRLRELVARMRAVLRRPRPEEVVAGGEVLEVGDLRLDAERHEVFLRG